MIKYIKKGGSSSEKIYIDHVGHIDSCIDENGVYYTYYLGLKEIKASNAYSYTYEVDDQSESEVVKGQSLWQTKRNLIFI